MKSNNVSLTSVWNLLSHKYRDVLMGLNGSKSMLTFFSFPSSVTMVPQYITKPLGGTTTIQTQIKSKDPSNDPNQTFKTYIEILA